MRRTASPWHALRAAGPRARLELFSTKEHGPVPRWVAPMNQRARAAVCRQPVNSFTRTAGRTVQLLHPWGFRVRRTPH
eukprot:9790083-Prorocentrum_lima.AAC.1